MDIQTQSGRRGLGRVYPSQSAPTGSQDGLAALVVFIVSTSKLYKYMQHTSWPKSMWN